MKTEKQIREEKEFCREELCKYPAIKKSVDFYEELLKNTTGIDEAEAKDFIDKVLEDEYYGFCVTADGNKTLDENDIADILNDMQERINDKLGEQLIECRDRIVAESPEIKETLTAFTECLKDYFGEAVASADKEEQNEAVNMLFGELSEICKENGLTIDTITSPDRNQLEEATEELMNFMKGMEENG